MSPLLNQYVREVVRLDLRSLALFRIGLGLILLADLAVRATDLEIHYADLGVLPRELLSPPWHLSLFFAGGSVAFQAALFVVFTLVALALTVGFRTHAATIVCWILLISLHARNPLVLHGGDPLLRLLLFWGMFLPLGERFSVDAAWGGRNGAQSARLSNCVVTVASAALIIQVCLVYWMTAAQKVGPAWYRDGTALYYAMHLDHFATPIAQWLRSHLGLMKVLTFATVGLEVVGPLVLFSPWKNGPLRTFIVFAFIGLHTGIALTLLIGTFSFVCMVSWLALFPAWFWQRMSALSRKSRPEEEGTLWSASAANQFLASVFLTIVVLWNVRTLAPVKLNPLYPDVFNEMGYLFQLDQNWSMFAPQPPVRDLWFVFPAKLNNGTEIDLWKGHGPVSWDKPKVVSLNYPNMRWRKYSRKIFVPGAKPYRRAYVEYWRRQWDHRHRPDEQLAKVQFYFVREVTPPPGEAMREREPILLLSADFTAPDGQMRMEDFR